MQLRVMQSCSLLFGHIFLTLFCGVLHQFECQVLCLSVRWIKLDDVPPLLSTAQKWHQNSWDMRAAIEVNWCQEVYGFWPILQPTTWWDALFHFWSMRCIWRIKMCWTLKRGLSRLSWLSSTTAGCLILWWGWAGIRLAGGRSSTVSCFGARNCFTERAVWAGASSW